MDKLKTMISDLLAAETYINWVEFVVILSFLVFCGFIGYSLNLFRKNS